jgi:hypothetical protein
MAKKASAPGNKSQAIRQALSANPDNSPKEITEIVNEQGFKVTPAYVSIIKYSGGESDQTSFKTIDSQILQKTSPPKIGAFSSAETQPIAMPNLDTTWKDFRKLYRKRTPAPKERALKASEQWLDVAQKFLKPKWVREVASPDALERLREHITTFHHWQDTRLQFAAILVALRWAQEEGLCPTVELRDPVDC